MSGSKRVGMSVGAIAVLVLMAAGSRPVEAQGATGRFAMLTDPAGGVWVIDGFAGAVARCREMRSGAPRIVDIAGDVPVVRALKGPESEPLCTEWVTLEAPGAARPRIVTAASGASVGSAGRY